MKFEEKLKKLEDLVRSMESGQMSLDDMIAAFEEGRTLVADCQKDLAAIRLRIDQVTKAGTIEKFEV